MSHHITRIPHTDGIARASIDARATCQDEVVKHTQKLHDIAQELAALPTIKMAPHVRQARISSLHAMQAHSKDILEQLAMYDTIVGKPRLAQRIALSLHNSAHDHHAFTKVLPDDLHIYGMTLPVAKAFGQRLWHHCA